MKSFVFVFNFVFVFVFNFVFEFKYKITLFLRNNLLEKIMLYSEHLLHIDHMLAL